MTDSSLRRVWPLRAYLGSLLAATALLTFTVVGATFLFFRIPQLESEIGRQTDHDAHELALRIEAQMRTVHQRLSFLAAALAAAPAAAATGLLDRAVDDGKPFGAIYLIDGGGKAIAAGLGNEHRHLRAELLGSDLAEVPIVREALGQGRPVWGDKYLSALTGSVTNGFALPIPQGRLLLAEIPLSYLLEAAKLSVAMHGRSGWVIDRRGELLADTESESRVGSVNFFNSPLLHNVIAGQRLPAKYDFGGRSYYVGGARSAELGWFFVARSPSGLDHPEIRTTVLMVVGGFLASMFAGSLFALLWSRRLLRPLAGLVNQAHQVSRGASVDVWPRGRVAEFNDLAADLEAMAAAILERARKAQAIFNASPVPLLISKLDRDSRAVDINLAWIRQFRHPPAEVIGRTGIEFDLWASLDDRDAMLRDAQGGSASREATLRRGDGQLLKCRVSVRSIDFSGERLLIWVMEDITEIRRVERDLRELNTELESRVRLRTQSLEESNQSLIEARHQLARKSALLEATIENISQGITLFDGDLKLMVHNQKFLELLAFPASMGNEGASLSTFFRYNAERGEYGPGDVDQLVGQRMELARHPVAHRMRRERPDGSVLEVQGTPLPEDIGGFVTTYTDVTELVRAREQAERALGDLRVAQQQLVRAGKLAALGRLVTGVAHELNTPLGNALTVVSALEDGLRQVAAESAAGRLRRSVLDAFLTKGGEGYSLLRKSIERAAGLIGKFKQISVDRAHEVRQVFDLADTINEVLRVLAPQFSGGPVRLESALEPGLTLESYRAPLGQMLMNLVLNARIHGFPGDASGCVKVSARRVTDGERQGMLEVICEDDGCGMPRDILPRIFDPFFTSRLGQGGSGLGLHITHNIVTELLGGRIDVDSQPDQGTRFTVSLPVIAPKGEALSGDDGASNAPAGDGRPAA